MELTVESINLYHAKKTNGDEDAATWAEAEIRGHLDSGMDFSVSIILESSEMELLGEMSDQIISRVINSLSFEGGE